MKNYMIEKTKKIMEKLNVEGEIIDHSNTNGTHSEDVAHALNIPLGNVIKCLILKSKKYSLISVIILGNQRLDMKKIEIVSGERKLSLASQETVEKATGYSIGGIPPYALINRLPIFIDFEVMKKSYVIGSAGTPFYGLKFNPKSLERFNVEISDISIG